MDTPEGETVEPAGLRLLRVLVTVLTATMIAGIVIITYLIWSRYSEPALVLPEVIALPEGTTASGFTQGRGWFAVVTEDDRILIYDRAGGALRQEIKIESRPE